LSDTGVSDELTVVGQVTRSVAGQGPVDEIRNLEHGALPHRKPVGDMITSPIYSNTVIGTLAVDGWAVTFATARRGLGGLAHPTTTCVPISYYCNVNVNVNLGLYSASSQK